MLIAQLKDSSTTSQVDKKKHSSNLACDYTFFIVTNLARIPSKEKFFGGVRANIVFFEIEGTPLEITKAQLNPFITEFSIEEHIIQTVNDEAPSTDPLPLSLTSPKLRVSFKEKENFVGNFSCAVVGDVFFVSYNSTNKPENYAKETFLLFNITELERQHSLEALFIESSIKLKESNGSMLSFNDAVMDLKIDCRDLSLGSSEPGFFIKRKFIFKIQSYIIPISASHHINILVLSLTMTSVALAFGNTKVKSLQ
ncbi:hypothetical protein HMI54_015064 [Coelomomyces lativittatus]|nr:hypothetical protein HMI54_015064 [Coelomomyces lativittatus]